MGSNRSPWEAARPLESVTDRRITQALAPAFTFGFLTIIHGL
jgi:hypothetical protein